MHYYNYEASKIFYFKLRELDALIQLAKEYENNDLLYPSLIKSNIILLCTYFEVYIEELIEEYVTNLNENNLKSNNLPEAIKKFQAIHIKEKIEKQNPGKNKSENYREEIQKKSIKLFNK